VQPERFTLLFGMKSAWLLLSVDAKLPRIHLVEAKPPGTGEAAPAFCMQLRKELVNARLVSCEAVRGERACELVFKRAGETRRLWLFLFGRSAQIVLLDESRPIGSLGPARQLRNSLPAPRDNPTEEARFRDSREAAEFFETEAARLKAAEAESLANAARNAARKKLERLAAGLLRDLENSRAAGEKKKWADLIYAHLREVPRGASSVTLPDDFEGGTVEIPLLPHKSAKENAQRLYAEHKRLTRAQSAIAKRLDEVRRKLQEVESLEFRPPPPRTAKPKNRAAPKSRPYREFKSARSLPIWVGRGADRNDELTFQWAHGNDLWLHARDVPGAHVVVPLSGKPIDEETLADAATLAAHHSNARGESQVDVTYTLKKHVRKPPKAKAGLVTLAEAKTIRVRLEPERLQRLLATRVDDES
jgi:predicted ribosome quality control (RQC) complex YloA/Tae2 family protein